MEEIIIPETRPQPGYALVTPSEYLKLNYDVSIARGWEVGNNTERYAPMNTPLAKVNIQYDDEGNETSYDVRLVMPISSQLLIGYPDLFTGIELVKHYESVEMEISEMIATGLSSDIIDWSLIHYLRAGTVREGLVIWLEEEARTAISDEAVEALNNLGVTVVTVDSEA